MGVNKHYFRGTIKSELRDLLYRFAYSERKEHHVYTLHRVMSLSLLSDGSFEYFPIKSNNNEVGLKLDIGKNFTIFFILDTECNYVRFSDKEQKEKLIKFIEYHDSNLENRTFF